jgi:ribosomal-protein-alanine N-acetyltransferase
MNAPGEFPRIETERLLLTTPSWEAAPRMLAFFAENREHLARWTPAPPSGYYTETYWRGRLSQARADFERDQAMRLVMFEREQGEAGPVVGVCNFTNFVRGAFQACYLGYSLDYRFEGRGLMYEALCAALAYAFDQLRLHRIMANYLPVNERSGKLLRRLGFTVEGYARDYLMIAGRWQDHILTSLTNPNLDANDARS